jgi:hypothetical protein
MGSTRYPDEVAPGNQRQMIRLLTRYLHPNDARAALARMSPDGRGRSLEWIVAAAESDSMPTRSLKLADDGLIELLVELAGVDLLSDRELRRVIADNASNARLHRLHEYPAKVRGRRTRRSQVDAIAERKWHPGKSWANHFVRTMGFPDVYAGWRSEGPAPDTVVVEPCVKLPELRDFQEELKSRVLDILGDSRLANRAILTLPTGAGKTRTAVEAVLSWSQTFSDNRVILWGLLHDQVTVSVTRPDWPVWS